VPIKDIRVGDLVITREGLKPVTSVIQHIKPVIYNKHLDLLGTPDHPVITKGGIVRLDNTKESDIIYIWNEKQLNIEERSITDILSQRGDSCGCTTGDTTPGKNRPLRYIGKYGLITMGKYLRDMLSTIKTTTHLIMTLIISSWKRKGFTCQNTCYQRKGDKSLLRTEKNNQHDLLNNYESGEKITQILRTRFIVETGKNNGKRQKSNFLNGVKITKKNIAKFVQRMGRETLYIFKQVLKNGEKKTPIFTKNLIKTISKVLLANPKQRFVKNVEKPLLTEEKLVQNTAQTHVEQRAEEEIVYNLSVKDCPEYFANNILVHNCAIAYQLYQTEEPTKLKVDFKDFPDDSKLFNGGFY